MTRKNDLNIMENNKILLVTINLISNYIITHYYACCT